MPKLPQPVPCPTPFPVKLPILSPAPSSPLGGEQKHVEALLLEDDAMLISKDSRPASCSSSTLPCGSSDEPDEAFRSIWPLDEPMLSPAVERVPLPERKVDGPLTPHERLQPLDSNGIREVVGDARGEMHQLAKKGQPTPYIGSDELVVEVVRPIAQQVKHTVRSERLQEADTVSRVKIPKLDYTLPTAPWKGSPSVRRSTAKCGRMADKQMLLDIKRSHLKHGRWLYRLSEDRKLCRAPFPPHEAKIDMTEHLDHPDDLASMSKSVASSEAMNAGVLIRRPDGLRTIGQSDREGDDIDPLSGLLRPDSKTISSLGKRKSPPMTGLHSNSTVTILTGERRRLPLRTRACVEKLVNKTNPVDAEQLRECTFSAAHALDAYIEVRGGRSKYPRLTKQSTPSEGMTITPSTHSYLPSRSAKSASTSPTPRRASKEQVSLPPPILPTGSRTFILSCNVLSQRNLMRQVRDLYHTATYLERDFTDLDATPQPSSSPVSSSPSVVSSSPYPMAPPPRPRPPLAPRCSTTTTTISDIEEADMLVSPTTGIIWTTMQKIKQRRLPGQAARSAIKERIVALVARYDRLIVLVSEGRLGAHESEAAWDAMDLAGKEKEALDQLRLFANSLRDSDVKVEYQPGGEDALARALVIQMSTHAADQRVSRLKLAEEETQAELHLRRAGLNAYAVLVVLAELLQQAQKAGPHVSASDGEESPDIAALAFFVSMRHEERVRRFEGLLGGRRALDSIERDIRQAHRRR